MEKTFGLLANRDLCIPNLYVYVVQVVYCTAKIRFLIAVLETHFNQASAAVALYLIMAAIDSAWLKMGFLSTKWKSVFKAGCTYSDNTCTTIQYSCVKFRESAL